MVYAVIHNNTVINRILWDGKEKFTYPFPHDDLIKDETRTLKIGMFWADGKWNERIPTLEEIEAQKAVELDSEIVKIMLQIKESVKTIEDLQVYKAALSTEKESVEQVNQ